MAATQPAVILEAPTPQVPTHMQIVALAHGLWLERGCTEGSAEADWLWAEQELLRQAANENLQGPTRRRSSKPSKRVTTALR